MSENAPAGSMPASVRWTCALFLGLIGALGLGKSLLFDDSIPQPGTQAQNAALTEITIEPSQTKESTPEIQPLMGETVAKAKPSETSTDEASSPTSDSIQKRINVNTASAAELELLPRIGPVMAGRIIENRAANGAYRSIEDLQRVRGIGPKTAEQLRPLVSFKAD